MKKLTSSETLIELKNAIPRYRKNFDKAVIGYDEAKEDKIFSPSVEEDLDKLIKHTRSILNNIDRSIALAGSADTDKLSLDKIVEDLVGYHEYILDADVYLLVLIKEEYESSLRG